MHPRCALLQSPHWRLLPGSQSSVTSRKYRLVGRPWVFRVLFGTGPWSSGFWYYPCSTLFKPVTSFCTRMLKFKVAIRKIESNRHTCSLQEWHHSWSYHKHSLHTCELCRHNQQVVLSARHLHIIFSYQTNVLHFKPLLADSDDISVILWISKVKLLSTLSHCQTCPHHATGAVAFLEKKGFQNSLLLQITASVNGI